MKEHPVDILLATYNGAPFLQEQIESILDQTYDNIRLMIRDDSSTDGTAEILNTYAERYPSRIHLMPCGDRLGIKGNFSSLLQHSTANYIAFADQDDIWQKDKIALALRKMKEMETKFSKIPLMVHSDLTVVDGRGNTVAPSFWRYTGISPSRGQTLNRLLMQNVVTGCAMMINRPLMNMACPIPEVAVMHDWWIALVASAFGQIAEIPEATIMYRQHGKNALGAKKMWSYHFIQKGLQKLRLGIPERERQGKELLVRYSQQLTDDQKDLIQAYLQLPSAPFLKRTRTICKYQLYRMGLLRNLVGILLRT